MKFGNNHLNLFYIISYLSFIIIYPLNIDAKDSTINNNEISLEERVKSIEDRLTKIDLRSLKDKISLGIELKMCFEYVNYKNAAIIPDSIAYFSNNYPSTNNSFTIDLNSLGQYKFSKINDAQNNSDNIILTKMSSENTQSMLNNPKLFWENMWSEIAPNEDFPENKDSESETVAYLIKDKQKEMLFNYMINTSQIDHPIGFKGATFNDIQNLIKYMKENGIAPPIEECDIQNDFSINNIISLYMESEVIKDNLSFYGKLTGYKGYRDIDDSVSNDVFYNGNTYGNISYLSNSYNLIFEKAYIQYSKLLKNNDKIYFSLGRSPDINIKSSIINKNGEFEFEPFLDYGEFLIGKKEIIDKVPLSPILNWNFDGFSFEFFKKFKKLSRSAYNLKLFCGIGYDTLWDNSSSVNVKPLINNIPLIGVANSCYLDNHLLSLTYYHVSKINDGFKGFTKVPFFPIYKEETNNYDFIWTNKPQTINRIESLTDLGNMDSLSLFYKYKYFFISGSMSMFKPKNISKIPFYEILGQSLLCSESKLENKKGYNIYLGGIFPFSNCAIGFEYNYGDKNWFTLSQANDSIVGNKLATRGSVFETYFITLLSNISIKLGFEYFDYNYTGSGNPIGKPVEISKATIFDTYNAAFDNLYRINLSLMMKW